MSPDEGSVYKPVIPKDAKRVLITSALPYINGVKHLGNLIGSMLPADVTARYLRHKGYDVIYICATDEHGTPAELGAAEAGQGVQEYCDQYHTIQKDIYDRYGLSFDHFGRTSRPENHEMTRTIFEALDSNGYIREKEIEQLHCSECDRFLPDRYVTGRCPNCSYERARGDQCESCTQLLTPLELLDPKCSTCGSAGVLPRKSKHLFLQLDHLEGRVKKWLGYDDESGKIHSASAELDYSDSGDADRMYGIQWNDKTWTWPKATRAIAEHWLKRGLQERGITRDLTWGVKVPLEGWDKVFYVWFDAPIGYIGATMEWAKENTPERPDSWKDYWMQDDTWYIQFMAKDNVPFHSITFPATILGSELGLKQVDVLKSFSWLNYEGDKFSTSQGRGVFMDQAIDLYPSDTWRYHLIKVAPERHDTDFTWEAYQESVNSDLNNGLGNLVQRILKFTGQNFDSTIPTPGELDEDDNAILRYISDTWQEADDAMRGLMFQDYIKIVSRLVSEGNRYFTTKAPWKQVKEDIVAAGTTLNIGCRLLKTLAILYDIIIPDTSQRIWELLGQEGEIAKVDWVDASEPEVTPGTVLPSEFGSLFQKIPDKEAKVHKARFAGKVTEDDDTTTKDTKSRAKRKKETRMVTIDEFGAMDLRVGKVISASEISGSEKLMKLSVEVGGNRVPVVAGMRKWYSPEEMVGKSVVIIVNLEPKTLFGIETRGMVLAATGPDGAVLLTTDKAVPPGSKIR